MRVHSGEGLSQGRGTVMTVVLLAGAFLAFAPIRTSAVGTTITGVICGGAALLMVRNYFRTKRSHSQTWVQIDGTALTWSTSPKAKAAFTPAGALDLGEATAITVIPSALDLKAGPKAITMAMLVVQVTLQDDRKVVLPILTAKRGVSVSMHRLLTALAAVPGIVPVDASALAGMAPPPAHKIGA